MALVGGGGAGNTAGSNPSGTGSSLNYVGNHAYAYSGIIASTTTEANMLDFHTTGNQYVMAQFCWGYDAESSNDAIFRVKLDGQTIFTSIWTGASVTYGKDQPVPILIPPYSHCEVSVDMAAGTANTMVAMVGEVY